MKFKLNTPYRTNDNASIEIGIILAKIPDELDGRIYTGITIGADYDSSVGWGFTTTVRSWFYDGKCSDSEYSNLTNKPIENEDVFADHKLYNDFCKKYLQIKEIREQAKIPLIINENRSDYSDACCNKERRDMDGWCISCGDPCF